MIDKRKAFVEDYLENYTIKQVSPAKMIYTAQKMDDSESIRMDIPDEEKAIFDGIKGADDLHRCMRKNWSAAGIDELRSRLLACEGEMLPLIQEKCKTVGQESYIEDAVYFFLNAEYDPCKWIFKNYNEIRSEYLKSLLCLVLGFRSDFGCAGFLMNEVNRFDLTYPGESYEQGPLLGLTRLKERF